jgi:DNA-binding response OmpR family regulator
MSLSSSTPGARPAVLLVDDDPLVLSALQRGLQALPCRLLCASSAQEAMALFLREHPVAVVTDLEMPGESGLWLVGQVRERSPAVACFLHTGRVDLAGRVPPQVETIEKPCELRVVYKRLEAVLEKCGA